MVFPSSVVLALMCRESDGDLVCFIGVALKNGGRNVCAISTVRSEEE